MLPPVVMAIWLGAPVFNWLTALFAAVMAWEWNGMARGRFGGMAVVMLLVGVGAAIIAASYPLAALAMASSGAAVVGLGSGSGWLAIGTLYIALPCTALVWLRATDGPETLLWLFLVVWATDIAAYGVGRRIGGPRLAPFISPSKTWSGAIGGLAAAMGVGEGAALLLDLAVPWVLVAASAGVSMMAQLGDLTESRLKRHFGVKDSGWIIPGHGGVFDRVDGVLAAALVVAGAVLISGGGVRLWGHG